MEYIPKSERKKEKPVKFFLKELTVEDGIEIDNAMTSIDNKGKTSFNLGMAKFKKFECGVTGWENLSFEFSKENIKKVSYRFFNEVVEEINKTSGLNDTQEQD